ncbi:hypothetical protein G4H71_09435 [Rhodococcus triatomae]|uniref:Uncharacterized protein n=1 Tax=Rhodococcus triatomae TaxID=300028 RepID=A0A1G8HRU5_9NOCA|nr:DUF6474 family protein [Rhodococcus triatomae]QNG20863.1 hypothetical protein G4H72_20950 [Rhodococcus triatomae]QNG23222.1 hypothetical protein G4H71_09435 [Rhodococcus triatomae]SDI09376.1 hypothetical protein SAMN05444695_10548 [Rhodococcus triatomae]
MGLFTKRKSRATRKAEAKALQRKAEVEAKLGAKSQRKLDRAQIKSQKRLEAAELKSQKKVEKAQLETLEAQKKAAAQKGLTVASVRKYLGVARLLAPVLLPIAYRAATALRGQLDARRAATMGVSVDQLGDFTGHGAKLSARVAGAETSVTEILSRKPDDAETQRFAAAIRERLGDLNTAIRAAEQMPQSRRRAAHHAIAAELDGVEADLLARLGVR